MTTNIEKLSATELEYLRFNSYVSNEHRLIYVSTPKVGCTSLKWWFAGLTRHAEQIRLCQDSVETDPDLKVHDCYQKVAPNVTHLDSRAFETLLQSSGYFIFALVRNPYKRIFSAWQSKILLREPHQAGPYRDAPFYDLPVTSESEVATAFQAFLEYLAESEAPAFRDLHWTPQADLLCPGKVHYSYFGKIEEPAALDSALMVHMGSAFSSPFAQRRTNESLLTFSAQFVTPRAAELVRQLYERDFSELGYSLELPVGPVIDAGAIATALHAIQMIRARHERIAEMRFHFSDAGIAVGRELEEKGHDVMVSLPRVEPLEAELDAYRRQATEFASQVARLQRNLASAQTHIMAQASELDAYRRQATEFASQVARLQGELLAMQAQRQRELASGRFLVRCLIRWAIRSLRRLF